MASSRLNLMDLEIICGAGGDWFRWRRAEETSCEMSFSVIKKGVHHEILKFGRSDTFLHLDIVDLKS